MINGMKMGIAMATAARGMVANFRLAWGLGWGSSHRDVRVRWASNRRLQGDGCENIRVQMRRVAVGGMIWHGFIATRAVRQAC